MYSNSFEFILMMGINVKGNEHFYVRKHLPGMCGLCSDYIQNDLTLEIVVVNNRSTMQICDVL